MVYVEILILYLDNKYLMLEQSIWGQTNQLLE